MHDRCVIRRATGQVLDEATGQYVTTWLTIYEGHCRKMNRSGYESRPDAGGVRPTVESDEIHLPMSSAAAMDVQPHDVVEMTVSVNAALVGRLYRVASDQDATHRTARRLRVEETSA